MKVTIKPKNIFDFIGATFQAGFGNDKRLLEAFADFGNWSEILGWGSV